MHVHPTRARDREVIPRPVRAWIPPQEHIVAYARLDMHGMCHYLTKTVSLISMSVLATLVNMLVPVPRDQTHPTTTPARAHQVTTDITALEIPTSVCPIPAECTIAALSALNT